MKKVLCFGDSNTFGYMPFGVGRYDINTRYPGIIKNYGYDVIEDGVCGRTTIYEDYREGLKGIDKISESLKNKVDIIIVMLGSNDYKKDNIRNLDDLYNANNLFYDELEKYRNKAKVLLVSPPYLLEDIKLTDPCYDDTSYKLSLEAHNVYRRIASERGYEFFDAAPICIVGEDNCHLTKEGHINLGNALINILNKM